MKIQIIRHREVLHKAQEKAFKDLVDIIGIKLTQEITKVQQWSGFEDARDIVDFGTLRASQQANHLGPDKVEFIYPLDYALPVHQGYTRITENGSFTVPARPWTLNVQKSVQQKTIFEKLLKQYLR